MRVCMCKYRTVSKAEVLAKEFGGRAVESLEGSGIDASRIGVVICTVPAAAGFEVFYFYAFRIIGYFSLIFQAVMLLSCSIKLIIACMYVYVYI